MSRAVRQHARSLAWRVLVWLPVLGLFVVQVEEGVRGAGKRVGMVIWTEIQPVTVADVGPNTPADTAGLEIGDVIRSVDGVPLVDYLDYDREAIRFEAGEEVIFSIERGSERHDLGLMPGMPVDWQPFVWNGLILLTFLCMSVLTIAKRPGSLPSQLLHRLFLLMAAEVALPPLIVGSPAVEVATYAVAYLVLGAQFAVGLHLAALIPERPRWLRRLPWLVAVTYAVGFGIGALGCLTYLAESVFHLSVLPWTLEQAEALLYAEGLVFWATLMTLALVYPIVRHPDAAARRQAAIVALGLSPWLLYSYVFYFVESLLGIDLPLWVSEYSSFTLLPFPIAVFVALRLDDTVRQKILRDLIQQVREAGSIDKVSLLISDNLNRAFHTKCNYVFFREERGAELTSVHTSGRHLTTERIPNSYEILKIAGYRAEPLVYPDDWTGFLPAEERQWLDGLEANLIVPLAESDGHLAGLLILGQKRSEEPYTPDDLELLQSLARQIAMAYENLGLQMKIEERERIERQVLDRLEGREIFVVKECPECGFCFDSHEEVCPRDGHKLVLKLPVERLIGERYRLEQVLGKGGAAVVYLASDLRLNRGVAIKVLTLTLTEDAHAPRRFAREARVAAQLLHPNIVTTHDFGKTRNGLPFIVMEYLEGHTLRQLLEREGPLAGRRAAEVFAQVLDGLGAAHALGVVHRDLKPDNVFVLFAEGRRRRRVVKILDFGLAKVQAPLSTDDLLTTPGAIMGTLAYMAPEQLEGGEVDHRTDLYSVGVMVYEILTGERPFTGRSAPQVLTAVLKGDFDFPDDTPAARALERILGKCFARKRGDRYRSAASLRKELVPALESWDPKSLKKKTEEVPA